MNKTLEERITMLEDLEAIKQLKSKYAYDLDGRDWDGVCDFFTEDGKADFGPWGQYVGKKEIEKFYKETFPPTTTFTLHLTQDPIITVEGDRAKGKWYLHESVTFTEGNKATWGAAIYEDEFVKRNGKWRCIYSLVRMIYLTPYEEGWVKKKMLF